MISTRVWPPKEDSLTRLDEVGIQCQTVCKTAGTKTLISATFARHAGLGMTGFGPGQAPPMKLRDATHAGPSAQAKFWALAPPRYGDEEVPTRRVIHFWVLDTLPMDILLAPEALERMGLLPPNWPYHNSTWGTKVGDPPEDRLPRKQGTVRA